MVARDMHPPARDRLVYLQAGHLRRIVKLNILAVIALATSAGGPARADVLSGCGSCLGASYLLQYNSAPVGTFDGGGKIYDVFFSIDTTNLDDIGATNVKAVAIKIASSVDITNSSLAAGPGGAALWALQPSILNASGCGVGRGSGFLCAQDAPPNAAILPSSGIYRWEFLYGTTDPLFTANLGSEIKVDYSDAAGKKVGGALFSEAFTLQSCTTDCGGSTGGSPAPEPAAIILLSSVIGLTGLALRKKYRKA
jgi:hypothetical protein